MNLLGGLDYLEKNRILYKFALSQKAQYSVEILEDESPENRKAFFSSLN